MTMALVLGGPGGVLPTSLALATQRMAPKAAVDFDALMAQAEEQRSAGEHAAAARSYAAAYRSLPEGERTGLMGELAVDNALVDYRAAYEQRPERALIEEPLVLLVELEEERTRAHGAGEAEAVPPRLLEEQDRLRTQLQALEDAEVEDAIEPLPPPVEEDRSEQTRPSKRSPTPRWIWAGLGVSAGLFLVGASTVIGTGVWLTAPESRSFGFRPQLIEAGLATSIEGVSEPGDSSNPDANNGAFFEVNPAELPPFVDICEYNTHDYSLDGNGFYAKGEPLTANGGQGSRNIEVAKVCRRGENLRKVQVAFGIVAIAGLVSTATFTTLLLLHRRRSHKAASAWQRRGLGLQLGPTPGQGFAVGLQGRL
ncbi:hypothetical protein [Paraliomyxa miuraensis]|uniref:hypothetical protein n=1 Tax=Paraliomyxa miuraensis TaxID=376150 RepID=UPI00225212D7|nr:hypothetical protein [Paraliomyxa miuraensis]MCX4240528.1 hypothetical protein [Paraliomyxa miuraensis]